MTGARYLVAIVGMVSVLGGCNSDDGKPSGSERAAAGPSADPALPPQIITDQAIAAQPAGSPGRAMLLWWQAAQFTDVDGVTSLTSPTVINEFGEAKFARLVQTVGSSLGRVRIVSTSKSNNTAAVRVAITGFKAGTDKPTSSQLTTFDFARIRGDWLFAADRYLESVARNYPDF